MSTREIKERVELLQGTLDLLILRTLRLGPTHGHAIAKSIERCSGDVLQVEQGSLYPALHRLIKRRWIAAEEGISDNNRRARYYTAHRQRASAARDRNRQMGQAGPRHRGVLAPATDEGRSVIRHRRELAAISTRTFATTLTAKPRTTSTAA